ncbi:hypothetical protein HYQ45_009607 [Verticillium longisporum]|uniref:Ribosome recycling factor domain-containing protein n=1 Tax=Verticillium longisporum TaxID=100787 RepID=A0A8I2ZJI5_VERLO|nr:hypothetical protein HYQ45_009607 [Verticillium longisporum]
MNSFRAHRLALPRANAIIRAAASQNVAPIFHTTPAALKKSKAKKMVEQQENNPSSSPSPSSSSRNSASTSASDHDDDADAARHPKPDPADPLNTDDLTSRWAALDTHFRDALRRLATGGRFNPDSIGALPVAPDPKSPERFPLRELAQVVPKGGRTASPDFNQQPQPSPDNDLELLLKVEPERKEDLVAKAKALTLAWRERVRHASDRRKKVVAKWAMQKEIGPDLRKRVDAEAQKQQNKVMDGIDQVEKQTLQRFK